MPAKQRETTPRTRQTSLGSIFDGGGGVRASAPSASALARLSPENRDILASAQEAVEALGADAKPNHPVVQMRNKLIAKLLQRKGVGSDATPLADSAPSVHIVTPAVNIQPAPTVNVLQAPTVQIVPAPTVNVVQAPTVNFVPAPTVNIVPAPTVNIVDMESSTTADNPGGLTSDSTGQAVDAAPEALVTPETPTVNLEAVTPESTVGTVDATPVTPATPQASEEPMLEMSVVTPAESAPQTESNLADESKATADSSSQGPLANSSSGQAPAQSHDATATPNEETALRQKRGSTYTTRSSVASRASVSQGPAMKEWDGSRKSKTCLDGSLLTELRGSVSYGIDRRSMRKLEMHFINDDRAINETMASKSECESDWTQRRVEASRRASMMHQDKAHRRSRLSTIGGGPRESVMSTSSLIRQARRRASSARLLSEKVQSRRSVEYNAGECFMTHSEALRCPEIVHEVVQVARGGYELSIDELRNLCNDTYEALFVSHGSPLRSKVVKSARNMRAKMMSTCHDHLRAAVKAAMIAAVSPDLDDVVISLVSILADLILDCLAKSQSGSAHLTVMESDFTIDTEAKSFGRNRLFPFTEEEHSATEDAIMTVIHEKATKVNQILDSRRLPLLVKNMQQLSANANRYELVVDTMACVHAGSSPTPLVVEDPSVISYSLVDDSVRWQHRFIALKVGKTYVRNPVNRKCWRVVVKNLKNHAEDEEHKRLLALDHAYKQAEWWQTLSPRDPSSRIIQSKPRRRMSVEERDLFDIMTPLIFNDAPPTEAEWAQGALDYAIHRGWELNTWLGPKTPLRACVYHGRLPLVEALLRGRANANDASQPAGVSVLHLATWAGSLKVAELLLCHRANPNQPDALGQTPIFFAPDVNACQLLVAHRADLLHCNARDQTPLHLACRAGEEEIIKWMVEREPSLPAKKDAYGAHPVYYAQQAGMEDNNPIVSQMKASRFVLPLR